MQERILIVDDDPMVLEVLSAVLSREGFQVTPASSGAEGLAALAEQPHSLALCDIRMPGMDGFELLAEIRRRHPELDVVLTTGYASVEGALDALALGAVDYLTKPLKPKEIVARLRSILRRRELEAEVLELQRSLHLRCDVRNLVSASPKMRAVATAVQRVADDGETVVLRGEPGSGRKFLARAIHYSGSRREEPFELVNCASPPHEGLGALLFGRREEPRSQRHGLLERHRGGSLHLHRLEHCPRDVQQRLGQALASRTAAGSGDGRPGPGRLIVSTDASPEDLLASGRLVPELGSLSKATAIHLPPLRERAADLPGLVAAFAEQYSVDQGHSIEVRPSALALLAEREFPGNLRELFALLRHAATLCLDGVLDDGILGLALGTAPISENGGRPIAADLGKREYQLVVRAVQRNPGRLDEAARELGVSRTTLWRRMRKYNIKT
jgi:DNA-binding NtrC family response regulator